MKGYWFDFISNTEGELYLSDGSSVIDETDLQLICDEECAELVKINSFVLGMKKNEIVEVALVDINQGKNYFDTSSVFNPAETSARLLHEIQEWNNNGR